MWTEADMSLWTGRRDGDAVDHRRWHQLVEALPDTAELNGADTVLGFACDEGVRRNQGRVGAAAGPAALRRALAQLPGPRGRRLLDAGDVNCRDGELEAAQNELAQRVADILQRGGRPLVLGGGHEVAWGSFLGIQTALKGAVDRLGIVNFDAHFDLRDPAQGASSGTPFRQIAQWCEYRGQAFNYLPVGINPAANTRALYEYARRQGVVWLEDRECVVSALPRLTPIIDGFIAPLEHLYLTICLDAFPAGVAPGVSAPGVPGLCPHAGLALIGEVVGACARHGVEIVLLDIAEMNPAYDRDGITARWAARLVLEALGQG